MLGHWPVELVDHVNGDRADNRWSNIRPATARQNSQNRRPTDANFGYKGVKRNRHGRWIATIQVNGVIRRIPGTFESAYAAHQAYKAAALEAFGQFARYDHPKTPELPNDVGAELAALKKRRDNVAQQLNDIDAAIKALEPIYAAAVERNEKIRAARKREAARVAELKSQGYKPPLNPIVPPYHPERR